MPTVQHEAAAKAIEKEMQATEAELADVEDQLNSTDSELRGLSKSFVDLKERQTALIVKRNSLRNAAKQLK